jgi:adenylate cyclase
VCSSGQWERLTAPLPQSSEVEFYWIYVFLVGFVFVARAVRWLMERRRGLISIVYPGGRVVRVPIGCAVLDASRRAGIPHASICGGM